MSRVQPIHAPPPRLEEALRQRKIPSLEGLRAVAVILVILNHANVPYAPEGRGVLTFFVLSGFLITWMLLNESEKYGSISIRDFYLRRALRIVPAFYLCLLVQWVAQLLTRGPLSPSVVADYLSALTFTSNYRIALTPHLEHAFRPSWALSVEEQFYLLWPWLLVALQTDFRKLTRFLVAAIALVDLYRMVLSFYFHVNDKWLSFAFDCRVDHILIGCLLAVLLKTGVLARFWTFLTSRVSISLVPLSLIILSIALDSRWHLAYKYAVGFVVDPLLTAILLVQVIAMGRTWLWGWLNWKPIRYLGQISYAMFLYHMLVFRAVNLLIGKQSLGIRVAATIAGAAMVGACSFHLIERKFLQLKSRLSNHRTPTSIERPAFQFPGDKRGSESQLTADFNAASGSPQRTQAA